MNKKDQNFNEGSQNIRYSVEVNFDTTKDDCLLSYAKIMLGYISAAMKKMKATLAEYA